VRQTCNAAYSAIVEWMESDDKERFDRELLATDPSKVSHGTGALMGLLGVVPPPSDRVGGARR
jgi:hypothetical protein